MMKLCAGRFLNPFGSGNPVLKRWTKGLLLSAVIGLLSTVGLRAQARHTWPVLHHWPTVAGQLSYQVWPSDTGWVVYLKNTGSVALYFQPSFGGLPSNTPKGPRVQLDPKGVVVLQLPSEPTSIQVLEVRAGVMDEGDYLP